MSAAHKNLPSDNFVERLIKACKNPETKKKYQESSHSYLQRNITTRAFNDFAHLLSATEFAKLLSDFKKYFSQTNAIQKTEDAYLLKNEDDQLKFETLESTIAFIACEELLNPDGSIK